MPIPDPLIEQLAKGNCVFFLGAGISVGTGEERTEGKGLPSGASLTKMLAEKSGYCRSEECSYYWAPQKGDSCGFAKEGSPSWPEQYCRASLLRVSQYFECHPDHDRAVLINILEDKIPDSALPLRTHKALSQIALLRKMPFVVTTNYDTLLEKALTTWAIKYNLIVKDKDIPQYSTEETQIVKLHGTRGDRDSYIITEADYLEISQRLQLPQSLIGSTLRHLLSTRKILFIGYSLEDQDFRALYHDIVSTLGLHQHTAFAVQWKPTPGSIRFWERFNVQIIDQDATQFLEELVGELAIALAHHEGSQAISALEKLLKVGEIDLIIGKKVASAMAHIESEAVVPILCQFLRGPITGDEGDLSIRVSFIFDLEEVLPQRAVPILKQILYDREIDPYYVRTAAADVLMRIGKHEANEILSDVLLDPNIELEIRGSAARALGQIGDDKATNTLVQALQIQQIREEEKDAIIRGNIASALGSIGSEEACTALIQTIQDSQVHSDVRVSAATALGSMKVEPARVRARLALVDVVLHSELYPPRLRETAALTLGNIGDQSVVAALKSLIVDPSIEGEVRVGIAQGFGYIGGVETARILKDALDKETNTLRGRVRARLEIAETLTPILQQKASAIAAEIRSQEALVELLSTVFVDCAPTIANAFLMRESVKDFLLAALEQKTGSEIQIVSLHVQAYDNIDRLIQDKVLEEFKETEQTRSMPPLRRLQMVFRQDDPQAAISEALRVRASSLAREILAAESISTLDTILNQIENIAISADLDLATVSNALRSAITSRENTAVITANEKKWNTNQRFEFLGELLKKDASQISRLVAQVDAVPREVANKITEALGMFKSTTTNVERESRLIAIDTLKQVAQQDPYDDIRVKATKALGEIGGEDVVEVLGAMARELHLVKDVRISAITALGEIATHSSVVILTELLRDKDQDNDIRRNAALALGDTGEPEAKQILKKVSEDALESDLVRKAADQALILWDEKRKKLQ